MEDVLDLYEQVKYPYTGSFIKATIAWGFFSKEARVKMKRLYL